MISILLVWLFAFLVSDVRGVILASGSGGTNTTDPGTGLPFCNVGIVNNIASGIFLGRYHGESWVLTASHVGLGPFRLGGKTYQPVLGSDHRLLNPDQSLSDICVFQIDGDPHLRSLKFAHSTPVSGDQVFLIGCGRDRLPERSYWIDRGGPWIPTDLDDYQTNRIGFKWADSQPGLERWGIAFVRNRTLGVNNTSAFTTDFLNRLNNAALSAGDSGGGAFIHEGGHWLLAGMLEAAGDLPNQPAGTSILANDRGEGTAGVIADLSEYQSQITALVD